MPQEEVMNKGCRMPVRIGELVVEGDVTDIGFIIDPEVPPKVVTDWNMDMLINIDQVNNWVRKGGSPLGFLNQLTIQEG
jgi:hypothetical protein